MAVRGLRWLSDNGKLTSTAICGGRSVAWAGASRPAAAARIARASRLRDDERDGVHVARAVLAACRRTTTTSGRTRRWVAARPAGSACRRARLGQGRFASPRRWPSASLDAGCARRLGRGGRDQKRRSTEQSDTMGVAATADSAFEWREAGAHVNDRAPTSTPAPAAPQ